MKNVFLCSKSKELRETLAGSKDVFLVSAENADVMIADNDGIKENIIHPLIYISDGEDIDIDCEYILQKPFSADNLLFAIDAVTKKSLQAEIEEKQKKKIYSVMELMGADKKRNGTKYAVEAVLIYIKHSGNILFKDIFSKIALKYSTTPSAVERALRTFVESTCQKGDINGIYEVFGNTIDPEKGKPSNAEFISAVAQRYSVISSREN